MYFFRDSGLLDGGNAESCQEQLLSLLSQKNYYF